MRTLHVPVAVLSLSLALASVAVLARDVDGLAGRQAGAPGMTDRAFIEQAFRETQDDRMLAVQLKAAVPAGVKEVGKRIESASDRRQEALRKLADNRGIVLPAQQPAPAPADPGGMRQALQRAISDPEAELQLYRGQAGQSETQPLQEFVRAEIPSIEANLQIARREQQAHFPAGQR